MTRSKDSNLIIERCEIEGLMVIKPTVHGDARGAFAEVWRENRYAEVLPAVTFCQDNVSVSSRGVLRGLHFQKQFPQAKLVTVLEGSIFDVAVDLRSGSPFFGRWVGVTLKPFEQFFIPEGFAHGFLCLSKKAVIGYRCSDYYHPEDEGSIHYADPDLAITWPITENLSLSEKDAQAKSFRSFCESLKNR